MSHPKKSQQRFDFIQFLYYACRDANMSAQTLDCIDRLGDIEDVEAALAEKQDAVEQLEHDASDLYAELAALVETASDVVNETLHQRYLLQRLKIAKKALERHADLK